jgi:hypothetical protein
MGTGNRVYTHQSLSLKGKNPNGNSHLGNKIRKIYKDGGKIIYEITNNLTREEAKILEIKKIKEIGRYDIKTGPLCNLTDGGEGSANLSPESRELRNKKLKETWKNPKLREQSSLHAKTFYETESEEHRKLRLEKLRQKATLQERPHNIGELIKAGQPKNMISPNKGKKANDETRIRLSDSHKNSEKCKSALKKLHLENKLTGRMRGKNSKCFINYDESIVNEILELYSKGWGYSKIRSYFNKIKNIKIGRSVIITRIKQSGIPQRKVLTNFNRAGSVTKIEE